MEQERIVLLRMARQGFAQPIDEREYPALYRDMQPGRSVYWNGFGQPPTLTPRAAFDDGEYNRLRSRALVKVRLAGMVGWIEAGDMPLFAALYCKPIARMTAAQETLLALLRRSIFSRSKRKPAGWSRKLRRFFSASRRRSASMRISMTANGIASGISLARCSLRCARPRPIAPRRWRR